VDAVTERGVKLRIAQVAPLWTTIPPRTYGGIELLMKLLIDELVARGHEVTLFASADCVTAARLHPVVETNLTELMTDGKCYCYEHYVNSMMAEVLAAQAHFDVVHFHMSSAWLPLAAAMKTAALFTMHTSPHHDDEWAMRRWPRVAVNGISRCQMRATGLRLAREFPIVHNGCDFASYDASFAKGQYLAFLGRLSPEKNPLGAIQIARACGLPIVLAGAPMNASESRYFEAEIKPHIDGDQVRWVGGVNHAQKNGLLRNAAALLFPIQWEEPFGLVMIEAMACGTPVVAHRRGSVEEVVDTGITGFHASVLDALPELVPQALGLDRASVRAHAETRFGFHAMVDAYEALYRSEADRAR